MISSESQTPDNLITNLVKVFQNAAFTSALAFTIFMVVLEEIIFQNPQAFYFFRAAHKSGYDFVMNATVFSISLILFFVFIYVSFRTTRTIRLLYFFVFTFAILSQYSYQNTFHRFMSTLDLYTAMNTPFGTWLDAAFIFFNWLGFIPVMAYLILLWVVKRESKYGIKTFLLLLLLIVGINSGFYHAGFGQTSTISVPSYFKTLTNAVWERPVNLSRETIAFKSNESPQNNIVLIIDESIRGDHLSVNGYHRPTTPYLEQLSEQGYIHNWGLVASAASCSLMSNSVIVSGLLSLPDTENRRFQNPIIFQYAKAMGYKTYHYDAQTSYLWNSTLVSDLKYIDHWIHADIIGKDIESDFRIADEVSQLLKGSVGNFIVINKRGVHFHYNSSYPPGKAVWTPISPAGKHEEPTRVNNSYDNGVLYNVDNFFRHLIPNPDDYGQTTFLYTSDHGETLLDGGVPWLHCGPTKSEATVPLLMITQHDYAVDTDYKASHYNIFATLLDLMQFPQSERLYQYSLSLFAAKAADSQDRYFLDGNRNLINYDGQ